VLGGRNVVPNARILPSESRRDTTWRRRARLGRGVGLRARINGVLKGLGRIVPSGSSIIGVQQWSQRWVSRIVGIDRANIGVGDLM
jgi:hypothetical protein